MPRRKRLLTQCRSSFLVCAASKSRIWTFASCGEGQRYIQKMRVAQEDVRSHAFRSCKKLAPTAHAEDFRVLPERGHILPRVTVRPLLQLHGDAIARIVQAPCLLTPRRFENYPVRRSVLMIICAAISCTLGR